MSLVNSASAAISSADVLKSVFDGGVSVDDIWAAVEAINAATADAAPVSDEAMAEGNDPVITLVRAGDDDSEAVAA